MKNRYDILIQTVDTDAMMEWTLELLSMRTRIAGGDLDEDMRLFAVVPQLIDQVQEFREDGWINGQVIDTRSLRDKVSSFQERWEDRWLHCDLSEMWGDEEYQEWAVCVRYLIKEYEEYEGGV